ncbi:MAG: hypothetical protein ACKOB4_16620 [Acidobacteriota bacterium]
MCLRSILALILLAITLPAQVVPNRGLTAPDLETARSLVVAVGGPTATLVYANRFDPVTTGVFDSLLVVYTKGPAETKGPVDHYAFIQRLDQRLTLALDSEGRVLPRGDSFLRVGLRRLAGASPILRVIGSSSSSTGSSALRNVDYQFKGAEFALIGQSTTFQSR